MLELYWGCLIGGIIFALITVVLGDALSEMLDGILDAITVDGLDFLHPMVIVGGITVLGGTGILLTELTSLTAVIIFILSVLNSIFISMLVFFFYVKPMQQSENSIGFSIQDLIGKIGEVTIPIPKAGYGEVMIRIGGGNTNQIAASFDQVDIESGTRVVVIKIEEAVLYVSAFEEDELA